MEKSIADNIFEKAKEQLEKLGMYAGDRKFIDYDPNINSISKTDLEDLIYWGMGIDKTFKKLYEDHSEDINDKEMSYNVRSLKRREINPEKEKLVSTLEYLENKGLLSKSEFALSLMQYAYDSKIESNEASFNFRIDRLRGSFWHNYKLYNPDIAKTLYQGTNLDENRKYDLAEEKFVEDWIIGHYGTSSPMHKSRNDFYSGELNENDFYYVIVDVILKEYGVDVNPEEIKKLYNEKAQQLQKESIKKQNLSPLEQREKELSSLEEERQEFLSEQQKNIER